MILCTRSTYSFCGGIKPLLATVALSRTHAMQQKKWNGDPPITSANAAMLLPLLLLPLMPLLMPSQLLLLHSMMLLMLPTMAPVGCTYMRGIHTDQCIEWARRRWHRTEYIKCAGVQARHVRRIFSFRVASRSQEVARLDSWLKGKFRACPAAH